jgi:capsular polysaccharide biosynthesis protein
MEENKKRFILYEYLLYFWKKKYYFIMIPLLTAVLCMGIVYLLKHDSNYKVSTTVFVGSVNRDTLTHPKILEFQYKDINPSLDVSVPENDFLQFTLTGKNKTKLKEDIQSISKQALVGLDDHAKLRKEEISQPSIEEAKERVKSIKNSLEMYKEYLLSMNGFTFEGSPYKYDKLADMESEYANALQKVDDKNNSLAFFEEPKKLGVEIQPPKTYWKESIIVGILIGLVLTVGLLMLMKYIEEARRNYRHD